MITAGRIPNKDVSYLDKMLFNSDGSVIPLESKELLKLPKEDIVIWGNKHGRYIIPTQELIVYLKDLIGGRLCVEICAGFGDLGKALGIKSTDSGQQMQPDMMAYMTLLGQRPIKPLPHVEIINANEAVRKYKPEVVIAGFATQLYQKGDESANPKIGSSIYGVYEQDILKNTKMYIHIGNFLTHGDKRIRVHKHKVFQPDWLVTRSMSPAHNVIFIWGEGENNNE